jgi:tetratricopeptide (TPR) repeat protein
MLPSTAMPISIFYAYAHQDESFRHELEKHLSLLHRQGQIIAWHDRHIIPGSNWAQDIDTHLDSASVILLLISTDFLASDYCYGVEMERALQRHKDNEAQVIPILLRPVGLGGTPLAYLQALPTDAQPISTWENSDQAWLDVVNGIKKAIDKLRATTPSSIRPSSITNISPALHVWNVPYRQNAFFTGREELLQQLRERLTTFQLAAVTQAHAINGLGGIGKTQTAIEYAYRYRDQYRCVLWVSAATRDLLVTDFLKLAPLLQVSQKNEQDPKIIIEAVKQWLTTNTGWLLIIDNADELAVIDEFLPTTYGGHILLTTRAHATGHMANFPVQKMNKDEGTQLLLRRAKLSETPLSEKNRTDAEAIVTLLDGLPLALDQAGAYIEETNCGLAGYLTLYGTHRSDLLKRRGPLPSLYPEAVATTWSVSLQKVEQEKHSAIALLQMCAFLAPDEIPEEILTQGASYLGVPLNSVASNAFELNNTLAVAQRYSLVQRYPERNTLSMHRLVQAVVKDSLDEGTSRIWAERIVKVVNHVFPDVEFDVWPRCQPLLPHAQICAELIDHYHLAFPEAARLVYEVGVYWYQQAEYRQAEQFYLQARRLCEDVQGWGPEHLSTAYVLEGLATLYQAQGDYEQAESLYQDALGKKNKYLEPDDPDIATTMLSLATLSRLQGNYEQAEMLYQQVLPLYEKAWGSEHPNTATVLNELATLYRLLCHFAEAQPLYERALRICRSELGTDHPVTAVILNELAALYYQQGKYKLAKELHQRALDIHEAQLGKKHPNTVAVRYRLAMLYQKLHSYEQAESLYENVLEIFKPQYSSNIIILLQLASLYLKQKKYEKAVPLYQHAIRFYEAGLSEDHLDTAMILYFIASFYHEKGHYEQAESFYLKALRILKKVLRLKHPSIASLQQDLATLYRTQGKHQMAEELYLSALTIREEQLGEVHPETAVTLSSLAMLYQMWGKLTLAHSFSQRARDIEERWQQSERFAVEPQSESLLRPFVNDTNEVHGFTIIERILQIRSQSGLSAQYQVKHLKLPKTNLRPINPTPSSWAERWNTWLDWE